MSRPGRLARGLVALAALTGACTPDPADLVSVGTLERDRIELVAETDDPIVAIDVREGERVSAGQRILQLDETRLRAQLERARALRDEAAALVAELERGPRDERITEARARLAGASSTLATAELELGRAQALARSDYASRSRVDVLQGRVDEARAQRDQARAVLAEHLEGTTAEELARVHGTLAAREAEVADAEVRLGRLEVRAPRAARVDALPFEAGERPRPGGVVAVLLDEAAPYARVHVPQALRVRLAPGTPAVVSVDGVAEPFAARLRTISHDPAFTPYYALTQHDRSRLVYLAEVELTGEAAGELPAGVPVEVRFELGPEGGLAEAGADVR